MLMDMCLGLDCLHNLFYLSSIYMKKYTSIPEYYTDFNESQQEFAVPLIGALEDFGVVRLQWNMAVYYKDNHIIRPTKNQSRRYF
jgi:hypothetical protein